MEKKTPFPSFSRIREMKKMKKRFEKEEEGTLIFLFPSPSCLPCHCRDPPKSSCEKKQHE